MSKIVSIIAVNSRQGRAVADSLLKDGKWKVRGLVRDESKAADLASKGVEIVKTNFEDASDLQKALTGKCKFIQTDF